MMTGKLQTQLVMAVRQLCESACPRLLPLPAFPPFLPPPSAPTCLCVLCAATAAAAATLVTWLILPPYAPPILRLLMFTLPRGRSSTYKREVSSEFGGGPGKCHNVDVEYMLCRGRSST